MPETTHFSRPGHLGLVKVNGPDAKKFLQGQLTCQLDEVSETQSCLGAHCNPQGRVLFLFRIFYVSDAYYLVMPKEMIAAALQALKKYSLFYKLELSEDCTQPNERAIQEWNYFDLSQGKAQIYPETQGCFLPHELNLHHLGGISWNKGCYTGQEIIARMHYRGKLKNQLYRAALQSTARPCRGRDVYCLLDGKFTAAGVIVDYNQLSSNHYQLLVLSTEKMRAIELRLDTQQNEIWEWLN